MPVPIALAEMNGVLRTGSKAVLSDILAKGIPCPATLVPAEFGDAATLIIDGQALTVSINKPKGITTFRDLSDLFRKSVLQAGASFDRIDITFDRYYEVSVKCGTRKRQAKGARPI